MLIKVLATGFYSQQNIATPVKIAAVSLGVNIILNVLLMFPLAHAGLALATSLSALLNAGLLCFFLVRQGVYRPQPGWWQFVGRLGFANLLMVALLLWVVPALTLWLQWHWYQRAWHLSEWIAVAMLSYVLGLFISGMRLKHFRATS